MSKDGCEEALEEILRRQRAIDLDEYIASYNHVPLAATAMFHIGATAADLQAYWQRIQQLGPTGRLVKYAEHERGRVTEVNWKEFLGQRGEIPCYYQFFHTELKAAGEAAVLARFVPSLCAGVAADAFHPILRVGFALSRDAGSSRLDEIAMGLAWWAGTFVGAPEHQPTAAAVSAAEQLRLLAADAEVRAVAADVQGKPNIVSRMSALYELPAFRSALRPLAYAGDSAVEAALAEIGTTIADAFAATQHFTLLHALTSCQMLRRLLPYLTVQATATYWHAICAAYLTAVCVAPQADQHPIPQHDQTPAWPDIFRAALDAHHHLTGPRAMSTFEHQVKLVYACFVEHSSSHSDLYRLLAHREILHPSPFY